MPVGAAVADLPAHNGWEGTRRDGLRSTFLFHVFELLPCKSQFAKKHDKILVDPTESARLHCAKLISAVNHVHSQNTKAGLYSSVNLLRVYIYFSQKWQNVCQPSDFFSCLLSVHWTAFILPCWINTEGTNTMNLISQQSVWVTIAMLDRLESVSYPAAAQTATITSFPSFTVTDFLGCQLVTDFVLFLLKNTIKQHRGYNYGKVTLSTVIPHLSPCRVRHGVTNACHPCSRLLNSLLTSHMLKVSDQGKSRVLFNPE